MEIGEEKINTKNFEISEDIANQILKVGSYLRFFRLSDSLADIEKSMNHVGKSEIVWDGVDTFVMRRLTFMYVLKDYLVVKGEDRPLFTAVYRLNKGLPPKTVKPTISGSQAQKLFFDYCLDGIYTAEDAEEALRSHESDYDIAKRQIHLLPTSFPFVHPNIVYEIPNCVEFDINGAHAFELSRIFPKSDGRIKELYAKRHDNPIYKAIPNYYVGMLCRKNHRKTYNWIIQNVSAKVMAKTKEEEGRGGIPIYINTDGMILAYPERIKPSSSKELGGWKTEGMGNCRFILHQQVGEASYWAIQIGDELKGNISLEARKGMDLAKGMISSYVKSPREVNGARFYEVGKIRHIRAKIEKEEKIWTRL